MKFYSLMKQVYLNRMKLFICTENKIANIYDIVLLLNAFPYDSDFGTSPCFGWSKAVLNYLFPAGLSMGHFPVSTRPVKPGQKGQSLMALFLSGGGIQRRHLQPCAGDGQSIGDGGNMHLDNNQRLF